MCLIKKNKYIYKTFSTTSIDFLLKVREWKELINNGRCYDTKTMTLFISTVLVFYHQFSLDIVSSLTVYCRSFVNPEQWYHNCT